MPTPRTGQPRVPHQRERKPLTMRDALRFEKHYDTDLPDDVCWPWQAALNYKGYGRFLVPVVVGRHVWAKAHRVSYMLYVGPIPEGLDILHSCHNRACVNPRHLRPGTHAENMRDMAAAGTMRPWWVERGYSSLVEASRATLG